jgi:hypothetical protein
MLVAAEGDGSKISSVEEQAAKKRKAIAAQLVNDNVLNFIFCVIKFINK